MSQRARLLLLSLLTFLFFFQSQQAKALFLTKRKLLSQSLVQLRQEAIVLYRDGKQELLLRHSLQAQPELKGEMVWLLSLPARPTRIRTGKVNLFHSITSWSEKHLRRKKAGTSKGSQTPPKSAAIGAYRFKTLASSELNGWLHKNGYASIPMGTLESISEKQPYFLVIRVRFLEPFSKGWLPPVRLWFPSKKIHVPLLLSGYQNIRNFRLLVVTDKPVDTYGSFYALRMLSYIQRGKYNNLLNTDGYKFNKSWKAGEFPPALMKWAGGDTRPLFMHGFDRPKLNSNRHLLNFDTDFTLALGSTDKEKQLAALRQDWHQPGRDTKALQRKLFQWLPPSESKNAKQLRAKLWGKTAIGLGGGRAGNNSALQKKVAKHFNAKVKDRSSIKFYLLLLSGLFFLGILGSIWWRWREHKKVEDWVKESAKEDSQL